jgi:hypothetical protein
VGTTSGSLALSAAIQHWTSLTPAQQRVIDEIVHAPTARVTVFDPSGPGTSSPPTGSAGASRRIDPADDAMVGRAIGDIAAHWPALLTVAVQAETMLTDLPPRSDGGSVLADAVRGDDAGNGVWDPADYRRCRVRLYPALGRQPSAERYATIAHEVFHCYQGTITERTDPVWIIEGQAEWVGATLNGGGPAAEGWWRTWLAHESSLWLRSYDAIGFYASIARHGVDPWRVFPTMLSASMDNSLAEYALATNSGGPHFLGEVSVDHAGLAVLGQPWMPVGPGAPTTITLLSPPNAVPAEATITRAPTVQSYDTRATLFSFVDPVAMITSDMAPYAFGGPGQAMVVDAPGSTTLCLRDECRCPDGTLLDIPVVNASGVPVGAALANPTLDAVTAQITVTGMSIESACRLLRPPATTTTASTEPVGCGTGAPAGTDRSVGGGVRIRGAACCMAGSWHLTEQQFGPAVLPAIQAVALSGGVGGRRLDIAPDGAYVMTDDGSDPTIGHADLAGGITEAVVVVLTGRVEGTVAETAGHASFQSTSASVDLHLETTISGAPPIVYDQHYTDASLFGVGEATMSCDTTTLHLGFADVTFVFARG